VWGASVVVVIVAHPIIFGIYLSPAGYAVLEELTRSNAQHTRGTTHAKEPRTRRSQLSALSDMTQFYFSCC